MFERVDIMFCVGCKDFIFFIGFCKYKIFESSICLDNDGVFRSDLKFLGKELMNM